MPTKLKLDRKISKKNCTYQCRVQTVVVYTESFWTTQTGIGEKGSG